MTTSYSTCARMLATSNSSALISPQEHLITNFYLEAVKLLFINLILLVSIANYKN